jgi:anti-sigma B factor antagonist
VNSEERPDARHWKVLATSGRMDALTGTEAERACHEAIQEHPHVALDLRAVVYMSSAGLRVLLSSLKFATSRNGAFVLIGPQEAVREVLEMSGFSRIFQIVDDPSLLP